MRQGATKFTWVFMAGYLVGFPTFVLGDYLVRRSTKDERPLAPQLIFGTKEPTVGWRAPVSHTDVMSFTAPLQVRYGGTGNFERPKDGQVLVGRGGTWVPMDVAIVGSNVVFSGGTDDAVGRPSFR